MLSVSLSGSLSPHDHRHLSIKTVWDFFLQPLLPLLLLISDGSSRNTWRNSLGQDIDTLDVG